MCCEYGSNKKRQKLISDCSATLPFLQCVNVPKRFEEMAASIKNIIMGSSLGAEEHRSWRLGVGELYMISAFLCTWGGRMGRLAGAFWLKPPQFGWSRIHTAPADSFTLSLGQGKQIKLSGVATIRH